MRSSKGGSEKLEDEKERPKWGDRGDGDGGGLVVVVLAVLDGLLLVVLLVLVLVKWVPFTTK